MNKKQGAMAFDKLEKRTLMFHNPNVMALLGPNEKVPV
jgi:hypothetical protein